MWNLQNLESSGWQVSRNTVKKYSYFVCIDMGRHVLIGVKVFLGLTHTRLPKIWRWASSQPSSFHRGCVWLIPEPPVAVTFLPWHTINWNCTSISPFFFTLFLAQYFTTTTVKENKTEIHFAYYMCYFHRLLFFLRPFQVLIMCYGVYFLFALPYLLSTTRFPPQQSNGHKWNQHPSSPMTTCEINENHEKEIKTKG